MALREKNRRRIVIVGANFGGLQAARNLPRNYEVCVVDPWPYFEFLPNIHELLSGIKRPSQLRFSKRDIVRRAGHRFLCDSVSDIRPEEKTVRTRAGQVIPFDYAIVAIGGASNFFGVPGADTFSFDFKSVNHCAAIGESLRALPSQNGQASVVIVGGGIEGVEALGEVLRSYRNERSIEIHLIEGQQRAMAAAPPGLHQEIVRKTGPLPVTPHMGETVQSVSDEGVTLSSGAFIASRIVVWTGGVRPRTALSEWGLAEAAGQWAPVTDTLQSIHHPQILVVGDAASMQTPLPKQAYHAMDMGALAARDIRLMSSGKRPQAFKPSPKPTLITFGDLQTFMVSDGFALAGTSLSFAKEAVYQLVMQQYDPAGKFGKAAKLGGRFTSAAREKVLPLALSPQQAVQMGSVRVLR